MAAEIHKNDIGTIFRLTVYDQNDAVVNLSSSTSTLIYFKKPGGTVLTKNASFETDGTDGIMTYTTQSGDIDEAGIWRFQGFVAPSGGSFYSDIREFQVINNIG